VNVNNLLQKDIQMTDFDSRHTGDEKYFQIIMQKIYSDSMAHEYTDMNRFIFVTSIS